MKRLLFMFLPTLIIFVASHSARADPESCREALDQYHSAKNEVSEALHSYSACIENSDAHDDCSSEFSTLHSAQDDFESAVSEYESECS
jgi:hypothetical protein